MPRARNGKSGGYQTRSVSSLGGWLRWIGCAAVWEAGRAVCGERHLEQTQGYSPTATEDDGVGRGDIHTYAIRNNLSDVLLALSAPSAPQPRPSRLIRAPTRSSKVHEWRCCDREGGVLDRESANKVVDHWRS